LNLGRLTDTKSFRADRFPSLDIKSVIIIMLTVVLDQFCFTDISNGQASARSAVATGKGRSDAIDQGSDRQ
jgi:hypothetical protein